MLLFGLCETAFREGELALEAPLRLEVAGLHDTLQGRADHLVDAGRLALIALLVKEPDRDLYQSDVTGVISMKPSSAYQRLVSSSRHSTEPQSH
ncbi:MAG: hypothetical protein ACAH81_04295 [Actinomycetota bacterium]